MNAAVLWTLIEIAQGGQGHVHVLGNYASLEECRTDQNDHRIAFCIPTRFLAPETFNVYPPQLTSRK